MERGKQSDGSPKLNRRIRSFCAPCTDIDDTSHKHVRREQTHKHTCQRKTGYPNVRTYLSAFVWLNPTRRFGRWLAFPRGCSWRSGASVRTTDKLWWRENFHGNQFSCFGSPLMLCRHPCVSFLDAGNFISSWKGREKKSPIKSLNVSATAKHSKTSETIHPTTNLVELEFVPSTSGLLEKFSLDDKQKSSRGRMRSKTTTAIDYWLPTTIVILRFCSLSLWNPLTTPITTADGWAGYGAVWTKLSLVSSFVVPP